MLPEKDWLVNCPNCLGLIWVDQATEVGQVEYAFRESPRDYKNADQLEYGLSPSAEGYLVALRDTSLSTEDQIYARVRL